MNTCRRLSCNMSDWSSGLTTVLLRVKSRTNCHRCPGTTSSVSRSLTTAANQAPGTDTQEKPRLRAIDLARKVRQENAKTPAAEPPVSSQQKRVTELKRFTIQLQNVHTNVLAKHLHKSVLYRDKDIVVINKPYGIPVRGKPSSTTY